jgi:hypothetical protein
MRYLALWRPAGAAEESGPPDPAHMAEMGQLVEQMMRRGSLIGTEPLMAKAHGARVERSDGRFKVGEVEGRMAGYAFLSASSREEAIELTKEFMHTAGDGVCELRPILEMGAQS